MNHRKISIWGIDIDDVSKNFAVEMVAKSISFQLKHGGDGEFIVTPNIDHLTQLRGNKEFLRVYKSATLTLTDGFPIKLISRLRLKQGISEVVPGSDFGPLLLSKISDTLTDVESCRVYLLGSDEKTVNALKRIFPRMYPRVEIVGDFTGLISVDDRSNWDEIVSNIVDANANIVFSCLGAPKQEIIGEYIYSSHKEISVICLGATLEFMAGTKSRAPLWTRRMRMEWLYRCIQEPRRLGGRYLKGFLTIFLLIFTKWEVK